MSKKKRIQELEKLIRHHRDLYYNQEPEISDVDFDELVEELEKIAPDSPALEEVGATIAPDVTGLPSKEHRIPMGSLDKIAADRLDFWAEKAGPRFLVQEKLDGISLEIEYENGRMVDAITRGDGFVGEVVTHNAVNFKNVRHRLENKFTGSVRGEVFCRLSVFERYFVELGFANPRNTVSGTARKKHGDRALCRHFEMHFFDVVGEGLEFETEKEKISFIRDELRLQIATSYFDEDVDGVRVIYERYAGDTDGKPGMRAELDYEIDGLVVRSDSIAVQEELGVVQNRPRFAIAYKFPSEGKVTKLLDVDWSLGVTGRMTPVARLKPVRVSGVEVRNSSLHNLDNVRTLDLHLGDDVLVKRRGDVIPYIESVVESRGGPAPKIPTRCPACDSKLQIDEKFARCVNVECPGRVYGDIARWIGVMEIESIGEKWIEIFIESGLLQDPSDLYRLTADDLLPLDRMGQTLAEKMVRNIGESKTPTLDRFVAGINIPEFSRQRAQMLIDAGFDTLEKLRAMDVETISEVKGFGEILAEKIHAGLETREERIDAMLEVGIDIQKPEPRVEDDGDGDGKLAGKSFCFTGAVQAVNEETGKRWTRKALQALVKQNGGRALNDVTEGLDYLVMADPDTSSSKAKKARKLGTEVLSEEAFLEMVE